MVFKAASFSAPLLLIIAQAALCHGAPDTSVNHEQSAEVTDNIIIDLPLSTISQHYINKIRAISTETGHAPTLSAFREMLLNANPRLSSEDYGFVWAAFIEAQRPEITLEDLRRLRSTLRDSITTFHATWTIEYTWNKRVDQPIENFRAGKFKFWMDSAKLRYDVMRGPNLDNMQGIAIRSYNGTAERVFDDDKDGRRGTIHPLIAVSYYFDRDHPLWVAKLIDSQRDLGRSQSGLENFQNRYAYPLEEIVDFNGMKCIQLVEQNTVYYLDPDKNYAYCGLETGRFSFSEQEGRLVESDSYGLHVLNEMRDCGDGIWLPMRATETTYVKGAIDTVLSIRTELAEVNKSIDPNVFEDTFPKGTDVFDGIHGVAYTQGGNKSIENTLQRVVVSRPSGFGRVILLVNLLALCVVALFFGWKFLRRAKNS